MLDRFHLLVQIIFALGALHLCFDAGFDLLLDLQNRHFALHQAVNLLKPFRNTKRFKQILLLLNLDTQMASYQIRQLSGFCGFTDSGQSLFRYIFLNFGVTLELVANGAQQRLCRGHITWHFCQILGTGFKEVAIFQIFGNAHTRLAFDQHFNCTVW